MTNLAVVLISLAWPGKAARLEPAQAQPQAHAAQHQHFEPGGSPVGEDVGVMGLHALSKAAQHLGQQGVDAAAQVAGAQVLAAV